MFLREPSLAPRGKKPLVVSLNLLHAGSRKRPRAKDGQEATAASAPTPLRIGATLSKGKGAEEPAHPQRSRDCSACDEAWGSPSTEGSRGS